MATYLALPKLRPRLGAVGWSSPSMWGAVVLGNKIKSTEHMRFPGTSRTQSGPNRAGR